MARGEIQSLWGVSRRSLADVPSCAYILRWYRCRRESLPVYISFSCSASLLAVSVYRYAEPHCFLSISPTSTLFSGSSQPFGGNSFLCRRSIMLSRCFFFRFRCSISSIPSRLSVYRRILRVSACLLCAFFVLSCLPLVHHCLPLVHHHPPFIGGARRFHLPTSQGSAANLQIL